mmetsp:Transcript_28316/g.44166  ORF Transcript_28316/g.44166 Transcript_28316/m.44166 type:complete len:82 (-) Transcript_28316:352-597(-)
MRVPVQLTKMCFADCSNLPHYMVFVNARMVDPQALKGDWECSLVPPGKKPTPYHPGNRRRNGLIVGSDEDGTKLFEMSGKG